MKENTKYAFNRFLMYVSPYSFSSKGFTIVELLIVFSIIGILTAMGMASYTSFNTNQALTSVQADVVNVLNTAKSRATSQVKPQQCTGKTLSAYQVSVSVLASQYALSVICGGSTYQLVTQNLPYPFIFASGSTAVTTFAVSSGTLANQSTITVSGYGRTKTTTVTKTGTIIIN